MFELAYPGGTHISSLCKQIPLQVWLLRSRNRGEHFIKLPRGIKLGLQWGSIGRPLQRAVGVKR